MYICILRCILVRLFYLNICNQYNSITITIIKCNDCVYLFNVNRLITIYSIYIPIIVKNLEDIFYSCPPVCVG